MVRAWWDKFHLRKKFFCPSKHNTMDGNAIKRRKLDAGKTSTKTGQEANPGRQKHEYHSSSEEEPAAAQSNNGEDKNENADDESLADMDEDDENEATDASSEAGEGSEIGTASDPGNKKRKRNDPDAFATSMSKILGSKLTTAKRADPVLSRSKEASTASKELIDTRLEARAKNKLREEKRAALEKGRVKDVMGLQSADTSTADIMEEEKRLRKTAQRGVIKLFNAVRAAQIKGEEAAREARTAGVVGLTNREERVNEMSKKGFLELIAAGGKKPSASM